MNTTPPCPKCKATQVVKNSKMQGKQWFKCKSCAFQFTRLAPRGRPLQEKAMSITLYILDLSMRAIARLFELSANAVLKWIKSIAKTNYENPDPGVPILVEIDEMRHYLKSKNKLWIWKACRREAGELIDWEVKSVRMTILISGIHNEILHKTF